MLRSIFWIIVSAIVIDTAIGNLFAIPYSYKRGAQLANYFDYGRSVESKIIRSIADNDSEAHISAKIGWFKSDAENPGLPGSEQTRKRVYVYGMSFSDRIGELLAQIDPTLKIRLYDGPGAPLNHSYAYYEFTRPHGPGDFVVLGVLASSLPNVNTLTHMTSNFERPSPHFYPRYRLDSADRIVKDEIDIKSLPELRAAIGDAESWSRIRQTLAARDSFYDPIIFEHDLLDYSVYLRLVKRALGQRNLNRRLARYHDQGGFKNEERLVELSRRLVSEFAASVRADGAIPYLILFNDRGYGDHLYRALEPVLDSENIPFYSTHWLYPATDLANFIPDGHFKPEIDFEIANAVYRQLSELENRQD